MGRKKKAVSCPRCASRDVSLEESFEEGPDVYVCFECDHEFEVAGSHSMHFAGESDFQDDMYSEYLDEEWNY